jgi:hypothetical protein
VIPCRLEAHLLLAGAPSSPVAVRAIADAITCAAFADGAVSLASAEAGDGRADIAWDAGDLAATAALEAFAATHRLTGWLSWQAPGWAGGCDFADGAPDHHGPFRTA